MKLTVSKSKNSASFYVQKTIRKPNGSVTTVTIEKLGNLAEVTAKAGGKDPYVWAQEYVNELNRREYEENKEVLVSYSPSRILKKGSRSSLTAGIFSCRRFTIRWAWIKSAAIFPPGIPLNMISMMCFQS